MQSMNDATQVEYDAETRTAIVTFAEDDVDMINVIACCVHGSGGRVEIIRIFARQRLAAEYRRNDDGFDLVARQTLQ
ncbi:hypothetical protein HAP48_0035150 [Bradyrhizobium septentrionale]|uniref:Uncharacterized protein n=1 Tax=Bradyrhizobium septentrionale TaxID=1404411 RepID=A0A973W0G8_9BRAD|nr:hypothetical protein [Bradyrhizobium septentrionale]UGY13772.1 hypothetical protein HAP48_0035150 [Bradyrhizobium septentrionale]